MALQDSGVFQDHRAPGEETASLGDQEERARAVTPDWWVSPECQVTLEDLEVPEGKELPDSQEETVCPEISEGRDPKVTEVTLVHPAHPLCPSELSTLRRDRWATMVPTVYPVSLDLEVTRVSQGCLVDRVCPGCLVMLTGLKGNQDSPVSLDAQPGQATQALLDLPVSSVSLACLDQGVTMAGLVSLVTLESLVSQVLKGREVTHPATPEVPELKVSPEPPVSQVTKVLMAPPATTVSQGALGSADRREKREFLEDPDSWVPLVSLGLRV